MGLNQKILIFTSAIIVALVAITLAYTTYEADRLARANIDEMLSETRDVWETLQADRYQKLKLGLRVLANDPYFKALVATREEASLADTLQERGVDLGADFFIATDYDGVVVARSDRPGAQGEDLWEEPVVSEALEGGEPATVWKTDDGFVHAVAVPMATGPELVGSLVAGYRIDRALADNIRKLTHSEVVYLEREPDKPPRIAVSSLGPAQEEALAERVAKLDLSAVGEEPFPVDLPGDPSIGVLVPLRALGGETVGSVLALRSLTLETAAYRRFRNSLILVSLVVMGLALVAGWAGASRITGPVRRLVGLVERARDGSYSGAVVVGTGDEIGTLARAFNGLLADLREKEQMIDFLREGITSIRKGGEVAATASGGDTTPLPVPAGAVPNPMRLQPGTAFAGRYEILGTLGKGGMGIVYRATDRQLDEVVALKLLRPEVLEQDPTLLERFKQELKLARRITHRNVLRTHDFSETDGVPYISMEYVEGVMLKDLIRSRGALPVAVGMRIAKQICQGLEAAHAQGVVHRDIKPQNMLIIPETGEVKIMDFGIARVSEVKGGEGLTSDGTVMGTPDYMPPEQAQGRPADFRSDIYSTGVVLFEMFTGRLPFVKEVPMAIILDHIRTPPPSPRQLNPSVPAEVEAVVLRCLQKLPARRYASVSDLHRDLESVSSRIEATSTAA